MGASRLVPDALDVLHRKASAIWPPDQVEDFLAAFDVDGSPTAYLFECRTCGTHLAYADFT
jgi:uncharacterized protein CbrC (UPF0167 family)